MESENTKKPFFSVIIPTYNRGPLLKNAIESVLKQTFNDYEIIVIDNSSKDNTEEIVKNFQNKCIKFLKIQNNGSIAKSRNQGIKNSHCEWIAFLDSDDIWYEDRLETAYNFIKNNDNYQVVCSNELIINSINKSRKIWKYGPYKKNFYKHLIKFGNYCTTTGGAVNKKYLIDNKILFSEKKEHQLYEDYDFWLQLAKKNANFKFLDNVLGEHFFHDGSQSEASGKKKLRESLLNILKDHIKNINSIKEEKRLWDYVNSRLIIQDIFELTNSKKFYKSFDLTIKLILKFPIKTLIHIFFMIQRKI